MIMQGGENEKYVSPLHAIRRKCVDCCCGNKNEPALCTVVKCPLYVFRFGKNPYRKPKTISEEQKEAARMRLLDYHDKKRRESGKG